MENEIKIENKGENKKKKKKRKRKMKKSRIGAILGKTKEWTVSGGRRKRNK